MKFNKIKMKFNKNNMKKVFISFLAAASIFTSVTPALAEKATINMPNTIYERQSATPISSGVTHEHIQKFTNFGWWNINVLRVDLSDEFTDVKGIFNDKGISNRDQVSSMVDSSKAVGGINGDFFFYKPVAGSLGALINDGEIISARAEHAKALPGIFIDFLNNAKIDYLERATTATNLNTGAIINVSAVNSLIPDFSNPVVLTSKWGEKSIGTKYHTDLVEVVVVEDKVVDVRVGQEAVAIPENGYVLIGRYENGSKMKNFSPGDPIKFKLHSNIDIKNTKFGIGGGSQILKNGQLNKLDTPVPGNHPRTGMGISEDGKELILVTIDGRGASFKGVNEEMFASILKNLGAYNALNLDGGGSTTMAIKPLDKEKSEVVNRPSDGGERYVVNGVGVFSNAPIDKVNYLKLSATDNKMFLNTSRKIDVKGYDKYHNPVEIDPSKLTFTCEEGKGTMTGNVFKALVPGNVTITVNHEDTKEEFDLKVLDKVMYIGSNTSNLYLDKNSEVKLPMFYGKDINGIQANIYPEDLEYQIANDIGAIKDNTFYSNDKVGAGVITAKLGSGVANIKVYVGNHENLIHGFKSLNNIKFSSYPDLVGGNISLNPDFKEGNSSLKLKYDFSKGDMTRAAYIDFLDNGNLGMPLNGTPTKLSLWVKGDNSGSWLRANLIDSKGKEHTIDFTKSIDWTDWEFKTANLPTNIAYPIKLKRIYVVETDPSKKTVGEISIDGLTGSYPPSLGNIEVPKPPAFKDALNTKKEIANNGFSFGITIEPKEINKLAGYDALSQVRASTNKKDLAIFLNGLSYEYANSLKNKSLFDASGGYKVHFFKDALFVHLNTSSRGIRTTDPKQWNHLFYSLNSSNNKNVFLLLDTPIWGENGFTDPLEADLLHEYLLENKEKGKNIFVIHGGSSNLSTLKDGIRYIELDTRPLKNPEDIYKLSSIDFVVNGSEVTYQINSIFNK